MSYDDQFTVIYAALIIIMIGLISRPMAIKPTIESGAAPVCSNNFEGNR